MGRGKKLLSGCKINRKKFIIVIIINNNNKRVCLLDSQQS